MKTKVRTASSKDANTPQALYMWFRVLFVVAAACLAAPTIRYRQRNLGVGRTALRV